MNQNVLTALQSILEEVTAENLVSVNLYIQPDLSVPGRITYGYTVYTTQGNQQFSQTFNPPAE